ncbi:MAG TPA: hypothetical protein VIH71_17515 [Solirubrobacteraceae bacterium]
MANARTLEEGHLGHRSALASLRSYLRAHRRRLPWPVAIAFAFAVAGTFAVAMLQAQKPFYTDSSTYWTTAVATFTLNGHFSLLNFDVPQIGYALPLTNHGLQILAGELAWTASSTVKLVNAATIALIGTVLGPALIKAVWPAQPSWGMARRLVLTAALVVFWSGFLNFPLSDFPGLAMALLALAALARTDSPAWMLLAGVAAGLAINMRPEYVLLAPSLLAIVAWTWRTQRGMPHASSARRVVCAAFLTIGFVIVSLPQSLAAQRHGAGWSPIPHSVALEPALYFGNGMTDQAYDTFAIEQSPSVEMRYGYPAGERLLAEQTAGKVTSQGQYLGLFLSHPVVMFGDIFRHIVNGLDPLYSTYVVENLHNDGRGWGRIAGFLLLFLALLRVLWPAARRLLGPARLRYLLALAVCCVPALPTQMERRYMLPVYLLGYILALTPRWPNPFGSAAAGLRRFRTPIVIVFAFAVYASVVWSITSDAISHLTFYDPITHTVLVPR